MAQYNSPPKQKPAKVDEFISLFDRLILNLKLHQNKALAALGLGLFALGVFAFLRYREHQKLEGLALQYFQAEKVSGDQAIQDWEKFSKEKLPGQLGSVVAIQLGAQFTVKQQWDKAGEFFHRGTEARSKLLRQISLLSEAALLENQGKFAEAGAIYEKLSQESDPTFKEEGRLGLARALVAQGKSTEGESLLFQLIAKDSKAPAAVKGAALNELVALKLAHGGTVPVEAKDAEIKTPK